MLIPNVIPPSSSPDQLARTFARIGQPAPPFYRAAVQRMVRDYAPFAGGQHDLALLDAFLAQDQQPCALLLAPTGRGKTSLLIHWLAQVATRQQWHIIFISISLRYQTASPGITLRALAQSLAVFYGDREHRHIYNRSPDQLRPIIANYLRTPLPSHADDERRLLLVIDGLDETAGWSLGRDVASAAGAAPAERLRVVGSVRHQSATTRQHWLDMLGWPDHQTADLTLPDLNPEDVTALLDQMVRPLETLETPTASEKPEAPEMPESPLDLRAEIRRISMGDPLAMRLLVEAIQVGTLSLASLEHLEPGLEAYLRHWLRAHEHEREPDHDGRGPVSAITMLTGLCATAMGTLSNRDLLELAPEVFPDARAVQRAAATASHLIVGDGSDDHGYVFEHLRLRELFRERVFAPPQRDHFRQRFVTYGREWFEGKRPTLTSYVRRYWIEHLAEAGAWDFMRVVLTTMLPRRKGQHQPWVTARFAVEGNYVGYLSDLDILWKWAEQQHDLVTGFRCALIASTIRSLSGTMMPELLAALVTVGTPDGQWSAATALKHVRYINAPSQKVKALRSLLACRACSPPYDLALEIAREFPDEGWQAEALAAIAAHLPDTCVPEVLDAARAMHDDEGRSRVLTAIVPRLPAEQQPAVSAEVLTSIRAIARERSRIRALAAFVPHLPGSLLPDALDIAHSITNRRSQDEALAALATHPSAAQWTELASRAQETAPAHRGSSEEPWTTEECLQRLDAARAITRPGERAAALIALVPHTPPSQRHRVCPECLTAIRNVTDEWQRAEMLIALSSYLPTPLLPHALAVARTITDAWQRAEVLVSLAPFFPPDQQPAIYADTLTDSQVIADGGPRAEVLMALVPHLPPHRRVDICTRTLAATRSFPDKQHRIASLLRLAPAVPPHQQLDVYVEALATVQSVTNPKWSTAMLFTLVPHLPAKLLPEVLASARTQTDPWYRFEALRAVATTPRLPPQQHHEVLTEMLALVRTFSDADADGWQQAEAVRVLVPLLPPALMTDACAIARAIPHELHRTHTLAALAPHLPDSLFTEVLETVRLVENEKWRAEALMALLPHLPEPLFPSALADIRHTPDPGSRARSFSALIPRLPPDQQPGACEEALAAARAIAYVKWRSDVLATLAPHLPEALLPEALELVRAMNDPEEQARGLAAFAPRMPDALLPETLEAARAIPEEGQRVAALMALVPLLSPSPALLAEVLETLRTVTSDQVRVDALVALVPHLPAPEQGVACGEALAATRGGGRGDEKQAALVLSTLAPLLPPLQQPAVYAEALGAAHALEGTSDHADVLTTMAHRLATWTTASSSHFPPSLALWQAGMRLLAASNRPTFLGSLARLVPWLVTLTRPEEVEHLADTIDEVARCWP